MPGASSHSHVTAVSLPCHSRVPAVITLRCMVQFIGRETKYRYGPRVLGAPGGLGSWDPPDIIFSFFSLSQWDTKRLHHNLPGRGNPGILCVSAGKAGRGLAGVTSVERFQSLTGSILNPSSSSRSLT